jgi:hypothetical protein
MNPLREVAQQALEALKACVKALDALHAPGDSIYTRASDLADRAEIALRAALTQPEQATVKESLPVGQEEPEGGWQSAPSPQVTQRIADMPMSEYRRGVNDGFKLGLREGRIKAEDEMREQQEPEPVAWTDRELELIDGMIEVQLRHAAQCDGIANRTMAEKQKGWDMERVALLYKIKSISPRREWQSLSEDELTALGVIHSRYQEESLETGGWFDFARAIEAALKEKNHD